MDACSTTEEFSEVSMEGEEIEALMKEEIGLWLANHGSKLFSLECSKFFAKEEEKKKRKPHFQQGRPSNKYSK